MRRKINPAYPSQYETEVVLQDSSKILLRPIKKGDTEPWLAFFHRLGPHTKYLRFHHVPKEMELEDAAQFCTVDYNNTFAIVAEVTREQKKEIVAIGRYNRLPTKYSAEIAFVVEDDYQDKGIGTALIKQLANVARDNGIATFEADVLDENEEMMVMLRDYSFHIISELEAGVCHVTFPISATANHRR